MARLPTRDEINAAARRLGIADSDGNAHRRDRAQIVEAIQTAQSQADADHAAEQHPPTPTADVLTALHDDLVDAGLPADARTAILGAAAYTHTARNGITERKDTPP